MGIFRNFPDISLNFSNVLGTPIYNSEGIKFGYFNDFFVDYEEVYPLVLAISYKQNKQFFYVAWEHIEEFSFKKIIIKSDAYLGRSRTLPRSKKITHNPGLLKNQYKNEMVEFPPIGKIIMDKQIVDISGKKVVRVNDIQLIKSGSNLRVTHAAIGLRSMVRRLGFERGIDASFKFFNANAKYLTSETLINWKYVHAIPNKNINGPITINLTNNDLKKIHPADLADILEDLDTHGRKLLFDNLDPKKAAETLSEVDQDIQSSLIDSDNPQSAAKIIENMDTDDAADLLSELSVINADAIISNIEDIEIKDEIQELLEYEEESGGGLMSSEVFEISKNLKKQDILSLIKNKNEDFETIYDLFIVDENKKLIGTCPLRELLLQEDDIQVKFIMNKDDIKFHHPDSNWKQIATTMSKYNLINLPIVDNAHILLGVVSIDDLLPWLLNEK